MWFYTEMGYFYMFKRFTMNVQIAVLELICRRLKAPKYGTNQSRNRYGRRNDPLKRERGIIYGNGNRQY